MDGTWWDRDAAWWAKAARARKHLDDISAMMADFDQDTAYEVRREPTGHPGDAAFRLHVVRPVPAEIRTAIGDALHNLRSCLDSVAFELARLYLGDGMTARQQGAAKFRPLR